MNFVAIKNNFKFLLTSAGVTNGSISKAIIALVGKSASDISVLFIPTAANTVEGDKGWMIDNLVQFKKQEYKSVDILDIAGVPEKVWRPRMEAADLNCFDGGNEQYLAKVIRESGIVKPYLNFSRLGFIWASVQEVWLLDNFFLTIR
jgi:dipeptidase E